MRHVNLHIETDICCPKMSYSLSCYKLQYLFKNAVKSADVNWLDSVMSFVRASDEYPLSCRMTESSSVLVGHRRVTCVLVTDFLFCKTWKVIGIMTVSTYAMTSIG